METVKSVVAAVVNVLNKHTAATRFTGADFKDAQGNVLGVQIVDSLSTVLVVADPKGTEVRIRVGSAGKFKRGKPYVATVATAEEIGVKLGARFAAETGDPAFGTLVAELAKNEAALVAAAKVARAAEKVRLASMAGPATPPATAPVAAPVATEATTQAPAVIPAAPAAPVEALTSAEVETPPAATVAAPAVFVPGVDVPAVTA